MGEQLKKLKDLYDDYVHDVDFSHLRRPGINFVPGAGPLNPTLMLIGEAPGRLENAKGVPFVGPSGVVLTNMLLELKIDPFQVFMTNVVKYWPQDPTNNDRTRTPTEAEITISREYLREEIEIVKPQIVGLCGRSSLQAIFPQCNEIFKHHGQLLDGKYVPLYHPAVVLYNSSKKDLVKRGYRLLKEHMDKIKV